MDKISNFKLDSQATNPLFFNMNYYVLKKFIVAQKGVDIALCQPHKYATDRLCATGTPNMPMKMLLLFFKI